MQLLLDFELLRTGHIGGCRFQSPARPRYRVALADLEAWTFHTRKLQGAHGGTCELTIVHYSFDRWNINTAAHYVRSNQNLRARQHQSMTSALCKPIDSCCFHNLATYLDFILCKILKRLVSLCS